MRRLLGFRGRPQRLDTAPRDVVRRAQQELGAVPVAELPRADRVAEEVRRGPGSEAGAGGIPSMHRPLREPPHPRVARCGSQERARDGVREERGGVVARLASADRVDIDDARHPQTRVEEELAEMQIPVDRDGGLVAPRRTRSGGDVSGDGTPLVGEHGVQPLGVPVEAADEMRPRRAVDGGQREAIAERVRFVEETVGRPVRVLGRGARRVIPHDETGLGPATEGRDGHSGIRESLVGVDDRGRSRGQDRLDPGERVIDGHAQHGAPTRPVGHHLRHPGRPHSEPVQECLGRPRERDGGERGQVGVGGMQPDPDRRLIRRADEQAGLPRDTTPRGVDVVGEGSFGGRDGEPRDRAVTERLAADERDLGHGVESQRLDEERPFGRFDVHPPITARPRPVTHEMSLIKRLRARSDSHTEVVERRRKARVLLPVVSVRTRLIAVITVVAALGLVAVGFVVYVEERQRILDQVDDLLEANLASARYLVEQGDGETLAWSDATAALAAVVQRAAPDDNTGVIGLVDGEPRLVPGVPLDVDLQSAPGFVGHVVRTAQGADPVIGTYADDGVTWRYLAIPIAVETDAAPTATFVIAYDVEAELAEINSAARMFLIASLVTLLLIAAAAALVTTRLLRPLRQMRETAQRVSAQSLSERLPIEGRDDVSELAHTMNEMLDRLDEALDSQRRLLSDVGHELKTPLTIVRGHLEVVDPDDAADVRETRDLVVDELERMANLVQDLAAAAALHGPAPVRPVPTDVDDLMRQILRKAEGIEGADATMGTRAEVVTSLDPARVTQAVLQLAQNAVTHGGGRMVLSSRVVDDRLELSVRDFGPGIDDASKEYVFDRFHRGADAGERAGSGLGLNIVQVIARAHGGGARVVDSDGGGAEFVISLPLVAAAPLPPDLVIPPRPPLPADAASPRTPVGTAERRT